MKRKFKRMKSLAKHYIYGMNYTAVPGIWPYPCHNGMFQSYGDTNHRGMIAACTRSGGFYTHPNYRYFRPSKIMNFGSFSYYTDVTQTPWDNYFRVPVPHFDAVDHSALKICIDRHLVKSVLLLTTNVYYL